MQKRLENLKRVAVMNPTDANLTAYMRYQRMVMNKSSASPRRWQRLVWTVPDLDYGLSGRPTNAMAIGINVFDEQQRIGRHRPSGPGRHPGLIFVFPRRLPALPPLRADPQRFEENSGFTVLAISMDGRAIPKAQRPARQRHGRAPEYHGGAGALPPPRPPPRQIVPVTGGVMSMTDLVERIAAPLLQDAPPATVSLGTSHGKAARPCRPDTLGRRLIASLLAVTFSHHTAGGHPPT